MEVKIGKGLLSQIEKPFESSNNKITLDDFVKFLKETDEQYNHRVNTRRERYAKLLCKDGKIRNVIVVEEKKESEKWGQDSAITSRQITALFLHHTRILSTSLK